MLTMLIAIPDADPLPLPAPVWLLRTLLVVTFFLHVIAMNFVLGGTIVAAFTRLTQRGADAARLTKSIAKAMPTMIAAAVTFGVAPLLFVQALYGRLFFTSSVLMAWSWLAVVPLLIVAYYAAYAISFRVETNGRAATVLTILMAVILVAIAFVYTNNMSLMLRPERFLPMFLESGRGLHLNLSDTTLLPRLLHMLTGAIAVAGLIVAAVAAARRNGEEEYGRWSVRYAMRWFAGATVVNMLTGVWWLSVLPRDVVIRFMGRSLPATLSLAAGVTAGVAALIAALLALRAAEPQRLVRWTGWLVVPTLAAMILSRDAVRQAMFERAGFRITTWVEPQWGVIVVFVALLIGGAAVTVWMGRMLWAASAGEPVAPATKKHQKPRVPHHVEA